MEGLVKVRPFGLRHRNQERITMSTRRRFLQYTGMGAAGLAAQSLFTQSSAAAQGLPAKTATKRAYELGLASYTLHKLPLDKALAITARVGLKHICLNPIHLPVDSSPARIDQVVAKVKAAGLDLYGSGVVYMQKAADVQQAFTFAKAAGIRVLVSMPMPDLLPLVNEKVQKYDIRVAIHNHGPGDKVFPTPDVAYEKIKKLDRRIGLCIDIGHTARNGIDPSQAAEQFADRLLDVHIKDINEATAAGHGVEVGRGVLDIPKFIRTLDKIRYAGFVSFEYEKDANDPLAGLAESVGYVRGVMAAI
jgi:inosose dehydratase